MHKLIGKIIAKKVNNPDYIFIELMDDYGIELVITATCLNDMNIECFNYENYPDLPIRDAVRMSISIPFYFETIHFNDKVYVDGGMLNNYPIYYFKKYYDDYEDYTKKHYVLN